MSDDVVREKLQLYADDVAPVHLPSFGGVTARRRRRRAQHLLGATSALVVVALVVVLAVVLGGSSKAAPASGLRSDLIGGKWSLSSITTSGAVWKAPAGNGFSLTFTSSGYTGNDSCNGTSGTVSYGTGTVRLSSGAMTELGCLSSDQARMQAAFPLLIGKDLPAAVSGGTLTITAGQRLFALGRQQPVAPVDPSTVLPGTTWDLVSIGSTGGVVSSSTVVPASIHADIAFRTKDLSYWDGCNSHDGQVSYAAGSLAFNDVATAAVLCATYSKEVEQAYTSMFTGSVTPTIVGDSLTLTNATGSLTFTRETPDGLASRFATALTSHEWRLIVVTHGTSTESVPATQKAGLTFLPDRYSAVDGCNTHMGLASYAVSTVTLTAQQVTKSNEAYCPYLTVKGVPAAFDDALAGVLTPELSGNQLVLSAHGYRLTFVAGPDPRPAPTTSAPTTAAPPLSGAAAALEAELVNHTWTLTSLTAGAISWHPIATSDASLTLTAMTFDASDGCNSHGSAVTYDASGASLTFGGDTVREGECVYAAPGPAAASLPPAAFFAFFQGQVHVTLSGTTLTLARPGEVLAFSEHALVTQPPYPAVTSDPAGKALQKALTASTWRLESFSTVPAGTPGLGKATVR